MKFSCRCVLPIRVATAFVAWAVVASVFGQAQVTVTSVYSIDYHGAPGVPEVGDPYFGVAGNFTITGASNQSYTITIKCGAQTSISQNVQFNPGSYWWWCPFDSSMEGPVPASFSISTVGSSSTMDVSLPVSYPAHAIEFIDGKQMNASASKWAQFQVNSGAIGKIEYIFGEPQLTSSQGPTIWYMPPSGATQIITEPLGIPIERVDWLNLNTAVNSQPTAQQSFSTTLHDSRVNPSIMRTIPWSAINSVQPSDIQVWQQSESWVPTNAPEITNLISSALPANYQSTMTPWDAAKAVFAQVVKHFTYNSSYAWDPLVAYDRGSGACGDFSYILVAGLRNIGFASHVVAGWRTGLGVVHVWAEFYMPGVGWVPADATDSNGMDPTGACLYHFGTVPDLNTRVCVAKGGNSIWPTSGGDIGCLQVPWWWWNGGATYVNDGSNVSLLTPTALSLTPSTTQTPANGRMFAHVEVQTPTPAGGTTISLSSSSKAAQVPTTVFMPAGWTIANFPIVIGTVTSDTVVTLSASFGSVSQHASFIIHPQTVSVSLDAKWYSVSADPIVSATLSSPATVPTSVELSSNVPGWALPTTLTIPVGSTTASVSWPLPVGALPNPIAVIAKLNNQTDTDTALAVTRPIGLFFPSTTATSGATINLTVLLASPAPVGGLSVTLSSSSTALKLTSTSLTIPVGATSITVPVNAESVTTNTLATISAVSNLGTASVGLTVTPPSLKH